MNVLWKLLRWRGETAGATPPAGAGQRQQAKLVVLPEEPYVFECRACGKVFEARRRRPPCPECDGSDVALMSE